MKNLQENSHVTQRKYMQSHLNTTNKSQINLGNNKNLILQIQEKNMKEKKSHEFFTLKLTKDLQKNKMTYTKEKLINPDKYKKVSTYNPKLIIDDKGNKMKNNNLYN